MKGSYVTLGVKVWDVEANCAVQRALVGGGEGAGIVGPTVVGPWLDLARIYW